MLTRLTVAGVPVCALVFACAGHAAVITPLGSVDDFVSPQVLTNDFEGQVDVQGLHFDNTASVMPAISFSRNVTTSGFFGLLESRRNDPLTAFIDTPAYEVGLNFGNDDFGLRFDATLSIFDSAGAPIGSVSVGSNGNDFVDQFIGLRSDTPFSVVAFGFGRPNARGLDIFVDDFSVGLGPPVVAEPPVALLLLPALAGLTLARRK